MKVEVKKDLLGLGVTIVESKPAAGCISVKTNESFS
jgi:hypothetical protein